MSNPVVRSLLDRTRVKQGMWDRHMRGESELVQEDSMKATTSIRQKRRDRLNRRR
jgi:hypothetical protein